MKKFVVMVAILFVLFVTATPLIFGGNRTGSNHEMFRARNPARNLAGQTGTTGGIVSEPAILGLLILGCVVMVARWRRNS